MVKRKREIQMKFWVTEEEKQLIDRKMQLVPTRRYGAYLRKMAIDGYVIQVDTTDIKEMTKALSSIGRNINQIAKRINAGGPAYQADMEEIRERPANKSQVEISDFLGRRKMQYKIKPLSISKLKRRPARWYRV